MFNFSVITGKAINAIVKQIPNLVYDAVKAAYVEHELGGTINPPSFFLRFADKPTARIIALPAAFNANNRISGIKWIGSNPDNVAHGFERASATIILNDYDTCYPIACLEGSIISALRTANSAVLAAEEIKHSRTIRKLGIVGTGLISKHVYNILLQRGWEIEEICLFDSSLKYAEKFATYIKNFSNLNTKISIAMHVDDLIKTSDLIVLATTAPKPHIHDINLFAHNPLVLNLSLRDLVPQILLESNNVVDDIDHVLQADTSPHLAFKICNHKSFIKGTIGGLINKTVTLEKNKPTIFSPMGMGILDLAVAFNVYQQALNQKLAINIEDFFYNNYE